MPTETNHSKLARPSQEPGGGEESAAAASGAGRLRKAIAYASRIAGIDLTQFVPQTERRAVQRARQAAAATQLVSPPKHDAPPPQPSSTSGSRAAKRVKREGRGDRRARRAREHVERFRRDNRARFAPPGEAVPVHRRDTFRRCQGYLADQSGRSIMWWLDNCPHKPFVQRTLEAALVPRDDGTTRYRLDGASPGSKRARAIVVNAILIYENTRKTRNGRVCRGLSEKYVRAVLADPYTGKQPAITTINGRHRRNGSVHNGQVGWLRALVECGVLSRKQYKRQDVIAKVCQSWELSAPNKKGEVYPINWYTLPMHPADAVEKLRGAELAHWLDEFEQSAEWDAWAPNPAPPGAQRSQAPP